MAFPILRSRTFTPPPLPDPNTLNAIQWLRSDSVTMVTGSDIASIVDLTPHGNTVVSQFSPATLVPNVLNGRSAIRAASVSGYSLNAWNQVFPTTLDNYSFFAVWNPTNGGLFWGGSGAGGFDGLNFYNDGGVIGSRYYFNGGSFVTSTYNRIGSGVMYSVYRHQSSPPLGVGEAWKFYQNGPQVAAGGGTFANGHQLDNLTYLRGSTFSGGFYNGDAFDWGLFDYCLSSTDLLILDAYVNNTWGI